MAIQFNLDGTTTFIPEPSEQEILEKRVLEFEKFKDQRYFELRTYRNNLLFQSDWTVMPDSPLSVGIQSSWKEYRQNLRNLPENQNSPDRFLIADWPLSPEQTEIPEEAKIFIAEISDPIGIGTTSWVGVTTTGEYFEQEIPNQ